MSRQQTLRQWAQYQLGNLGYPKTELAWQALAGDASSRSFYRVGPAHPISAGTSFIAMDAPPESENNHQFLALSEKFRRADIAVPEVLAADLEQGFLLVTDFGDDCYSRLYEAQNTPTSRSSVFSHRPDIDAAMDQALKSLIKIQRLDTSDGIVPAYTRQRFEDELNLFCDWCVAGLLNYSMNRTTQKLLQGVWQLLLENVTQQPQVCVHRDYHCRNLLRAPGGETLIVDFQDALIGPVSYDPVSLLRDCYVRFDEAFIGHWRRRYLDYAFAAGVLAHISSEEFSTWFDLTGSQRQLKAIGIFCRLWLRDARASHLKDIEPVLQQLIDVNHSCPALAAFVRWLEDELQPRIQRRLLRMDEHP